MPPPDSSRATVFGQHAEEYARWRPSYPEDAVDWLLPEGASRVAEVGAGTGKLTGSLLERGLAVDAVEPDPRMLDVLGRLHPTASAHLGGAQALPLEDRSVDAVLVADAWHWFPRDEAVAEVRRVLRPGGWLGLVWNPVAPVEPWEYRLAGRDPDAADGDEAAAGSDDGPFPPEQTETATFPWTWQVTPDHWRGFLATTSAFVVMDAAEREQRLDAAHAIVAAACESAGRPTAGVRHQSFCVRWRPG